jgi:hypothetical protein
MRDTERIVMCCTRSVEALIWVASYVTDESIIYVQWYYFLVAFRLRKRGDAELDWPPLP